MSLAIVERDEVAFSLALGDACEGEPEPMRVQSSSRWGSVTKIVTAMLVLHVARARNIDLDAELEGLGSWAPPLTLRGLLGHTSGLRDRPPWDFADGRPWLDVVREARVEPGDHVYANANYAVLGRWLELVSGQSFAELWASHPQLTGAARLEPGPREALVCGHHRWFGWRPVAVEDEPRLPDWSLPMGGAWGSAVTLARLPQTVEVSQSLPTMLEHTMTAELEGWDFGLGLRTRTLGDGTVLAGHSGLLATHAADVSWVVGGDYAVAVLSNIGRSYKATLEAAVAARAPAVEPGP